MNQPPIPIQPDKSFKIHITVTHGKQAVSTDLTLPERADPKSRYFARPHGPHRVDLIVPFVNHDENPPVVSHQVHGLDHQTAAQLLAELAFCLTQISPTNLEPNHTQN